MRTKRQTTVILANGDFPQKGGAAFSALAAARRVVACDGAADAYRRRFRRAPDVTIGDLDSLKGRPPRGATCVRVAEQDDNDLAKAIAYCRAQGWRNLVIVGATGKREDHTLGNIFRALEAGLPVVTDCGTFHPLDGRRRFRVAVGTAVSVFAPDPSTRMTSTGLVWPLAGVAFRTLYTATLNRASARTVTLESDRPVFVYIAHAVTEPPASSHPEKENEQ